MENKEQNNVQGMTRTEQLVWFIEFLEGQIAENKETLLRAKTELAELKSKDQTDTVEASFSR